MQTYKHRHHTFIHQFTYGNAKLHSDSLILSHLLSLPQSWCLNLISALLCFLTELIPLFDIRKNVSLFCATRSSPSGEAKLAVFSREKTVLQIPLHCSTAVQSSGQQLCRLLACQNTSLPCKLLCFVFLFVCHSCSSQASSLNKR